MPGVAESIRVTVVGAGNAGCAAAADLALAGHEITLFELERFADKLDPIRERGAIRLVNSRLDGTGRAGEGRIARCTTDPAEAADADVILVATVALAQEELARLLGPHLRAGQVLLLFTGYGGSLLVRRILDDGGVGKGVLLGETSTLPYICRLTDPLTVELRGKAYKAIPTAALPATDTAALLERLRPLYPELLGVANVLEVALLNTNVTRHTVGTILNIGRIEYAQGDFAIYREAFTPAVWRVFDALDAEKQALLSALGLEPRSFWDYRNLTIDYSLDEQAAENPGGPTSVDTRYLTEDVPLGLVLFSSLGQSLGVPTPTADALIQLADLISGLDFRAEGRTLERLGWQGGRAAALIDFMTQRRMPAGVEASR